MFVFHLQVIPMLIHPNDQVGAEVLAFLSVFMYDGNEVVQVKSMISYTFHCLVMRISSGKFCL